VKWFPVLALTIAPSRRNTFHVNHLRPKTAAPRAAFTLVEVLVVIAVVAILASLLLPALNRARTMSHGIACLNNARQLALAWHLYADDHDDRLPYNLGGDATRKTVALKTNLNWVNNILSWELDSDNTNTHSLTASGLGPYTGRNALIYRCPSDTVVSDIQRRAGWMARVRSYSMNAMIGDAGELTQGGYNVNNPSYTQFFKRSLIPRPDSIFVFLDEHPDSINDGYFLNRAYYREWVDLPASHHNGAAAFAFADGHSELHRWRHDATKQPAKPDATVLPAQVSADALDDYQWIVSRMSVGRK
jgi:prepilin-type N-terminal cleavage/methylation domain-containing protein/prepilin-type processing-associated H-X9-DG protein